MLRYQFVRHTCRTCLILVSCLMLLATPPSLRAQEKKSRPSLSKDEVLNLLRNDVPPARVATLARDYGVGFEVTPELEEQLRRAGADDDLTRLLHELGKKPAALEKPTAPSSPAPPSPPVLLLSTVPPGSEIYVDEERAGTTGPEGKLKVSTLSPGQHKLRISHEGYRDVQEKVELTAGENTNVVVSLEAAKPPAAQPASTAANPLQASHGDDNAMVIKFPASFGGMMGESDPNHKRFYVQHDHGGKALRGFGVPAGGFCFGYLVIGQGRVQYNSQKESDAFDVPVSEISDVQMKGNHLRLRVKDKKYHFIVNAMGQMGGFQSPEDLREALDEAMNKK